VKREFEEIKKRVEAIIAAYKLARGAYKKRFPSELEKENYKKYQEFRKSIL
jgi:ABC-type proline/glycine betaine transport system ATPase subunit